jgi:hypothetical protein
MVDEEMSVTIILLHHVRLTNPSSADKRSFLTRARYDAIAAAGGRGAVRKAIEKKQKKISEKEKKSRPFTRRGMRDLSVPGLPRHDDVRGKQRRIVD